MRGCTSFNRPHERPALSVAWGYDPCTTFKNISTLLFDDIRSKDTSQKRVCKFFVPFKHIFKAVFVGIPKVQEQLAFSGLKMYYSGARMVTIYFIHPSGKLKLSFGFHIH